MEKGLTIRTATEKDAAALLDIYRPYVERTAITFEYEVPTLEEFRQRICHTRRNIRIWWQRQLERSWDTPI